MPFQQRLLIVLLVIPAWLSPVCGTHVHGSNRQPAMQGADLQTDLHVGQLAQAGRFRQIIAFYETRAKKGARFRAWDRYWLCQSFYALKIYNRLLPEIDRLEAAIQAGDRHYFRADIAVEPCILRARVYLDMGDYPLALAEARRGIERLHTGNPAANGFYRAQLIALLDTSGVAHALTGQGDGARRDAARLRKVNLSGSNLGPEKHIALARIHMALQDFETALSAIRDPAANVSPNLRKHYDTTFQDLPRAFILYKCLFETGRLADARTGYDRLLNHPYIDQMGGIHWIALYDRARIAWSKGEAPRAITLLEKAVTVIERQRASISSDAGRIGYVGDKQAVYRKLVACLLERKRVTEAFAYVERAKGRALVDLLASQRNLGAGQPAGSSGLAELRTAEADLLPTLAPPDTAKRSRQRKILVAAKHRLQQAAPELASLVTVVSPSIRGIQDRLPEDEILLEYYTDESSIHIFTVSRDGIFSRSISRRGLDERIAALRQAVCTPGSENWQPPAAALYEQLVQPVAAMLSTRRLTIVPHGALHYLPFGILRHEGRFLAERHSLRILPSASVLLYLRKRNHGGGEGLLCLGNPDLGVPRYDLPFAQDEARAIGAIVSPARLLLRGQASETFVKENGARFDRLHFACHGVFDPKRALDSALMLAKDSRNDGRLTVAELFSLRLNADLVTLSACETALGNIAGGDDVVGFTRGLLFAGASSVVSTLWPVDDRSTRDIMVQFYRNLAGSGKREALRKAQLMVRGTHPHPFFWAAFQFIGDG